MYTVIFITCANKKEAKAIAASLIKQKLAACVNIASKVNSIFFWENKVDSADEILLIVKSKKDLMPKIIKAVKRIHSYKVPEIIALPIVAGDKPYLRWIDASVR